MKKENEQRRLNGRRRWLIHCGASVSIVLSCVAGVSFPALAETNQASFGIRSVTGRVTYSGPPEEEQFIFSKYANSRYCREGTPTELVDGGFRVMKTIEVGAQRGLKGAIVAVTDLLDLRFMAEYPGTDVVVENCTFFPFTGVIVKRRSLRLENKDADAQDPKYAKGLWHQGHAFEVAGPVSITIFNSVLTEKGSQLDRAVTLRRTDHELYVRLESCFHGWAKAFFLPVTNPYYAKVADDGSFEIKGVPPGRHRIVAWHPFAGRAEADIVVDEMGSAQVNFDLQKKKEESPTLRVAAPF